MKNRFEGKIPRVLRRYFWLGAAIVMAIALLYALFWGKAFFEPAMPTVYQSAPLGAGAVLEFTCTPDASDRQFFEPGDFIFCKFRQQGPYPQLSLNFESASIYDISGNRSFGTMYGVESGHSVTLRNGQWSKFSTTNLAAAQGVTTVFAYYTLKDQNGGPVGDGWAKTQFTTYSLADINQMNTNYLVIAVLVIGALATGIDAVHSLKKLWADAQEDLK